VDDASSDGEADVIKRYFEDNFEETDFDLGTKKETDEYIRLCGRHKVNKNCYFLVLLLKYNHYSIKKPKLTSVEKLLQSIKYVAICEGDDYWTDPLKLQKQVDFMDNHPDFSMCFHRASVLNETDTEIITSCDTIETKEYFSSDIFPGWLIPTASVVYRKEMLVGYPPLKHNEWMLHGDVVLFLKCSHTGRVWGMGDSMSVYRMTNNGAVVSHLKDSDHLLKICNHYKFLMMNFPQLDHQWPSEYIAKYYYSKMKHPKKVSDVFVGLWEVLKYNPKLLKRKIMHIGNRALV